MEQSLSFGIGRVCLSCAVAPILALGTPLIAAGANATWTASSNGAWDTNANWSTGAAASGSSSTATFGAASGTGISINTAVTIGTLQFSSGAPAYSLAVNSNSSLTLGASGIVNNSSNPLTLTVNAGARVNFNGNSSAGNSILFLNSQGVIDFSNSTGTITAGSIAGSTSTNIYLGSRTLTVGSLNSSTLFQGIISNGGNSGGTGGSLTKVGTGTLTLDRDNTYTGTTLISAGTLQIGNGGSTGSILGNVTNNASLIFNRSGTPTFSGVISGTGSVTKAGGGTLTLSGANTFSGGVKLNSGALLVSSNGNLGNTSGSLTFNGGTLRYGAGFSSARSVVLTGNGTFDTNSFDATLSGVISSAGLLTKAGSGALTLTGTNTHTGGTTISGGTLRIGSGGTAGAITGNVTNNGTLAFNRSDSQTFSGVISGNGSVAKQGPNTLTLGGANTYNGATTVDGTLILTGANTGSGAKTINSGGTLQVGNGGTSGSFAGNVSNSGTLTFNRSNDLSYGGVISGTGSLTKQGAGTLVLTGNHTFTGTTTISAGTLQIGNGGTTGFIAGDIVDNGVLAFNRSDDFTLGGNISGTGSLVKMGAGTLTLTGTINYSGTTSILGGALFIGTGGTTGTLIGDLLINSALTFNRSDDYLYTGVISGTGSLTKLGAGTLTFTGENLYTGGTTITEGGLQLGNGGTTGSIVGDVVNNSSLIFNHSNSVTFGGVISGSGTLTKLGAGTLTLTGANTFTGTTTVSAGTLAGTSLSLHGSIVNNGAVAFNQAASGTYAGAISGTGSLAKQGSKLIVTGANTYTGATSILGDLEVTGAAASLNGTSGITLAPVASFAVGTLRVNGGSVTTPGMLVVGETGNGTFHLTNGGSATTGSTVIGANAGSNGSALIASGPLGTWTNTGALVVGGAGAGSLTVENNTTLNAGSIVLGQLAGSSGTLRIGLGGSAATINTPTVTGGAGATSLVSFYHNDANYTFAPQLDGNLRVEHDWSGTTVLSGTNTYTGGTTLRDGVVSVVSDANLGAMSGGLTFDGGTLLTHGAAISRAITLANGGGTIDTGNFGPTLSGIISGSGALTMVGNGYLFLTGANTYTGGTFVTNGRLVGNSTSLQGPIVNDTFVQFNQAAAGTYAGSMSGSGELFKQGSQLTLTGVNTYTGATTVAGILEVNGGVINGTSGITLATTSFAQATLRLNNALSSVRTLGSVTVGQFGTGTLSVSNGSLLTSADGTLGAVAGSTGTASVTGANSLWSNTGALTIGGSGTGTLNVSAGGVVTASNIRLGDIAGSSGTLNIGIGAAAGTVNTATITGGVGATSAINFNHNDAGFTLGSQLGGNLAVNQVGPGTTILTAANTYTGLTTISGGTLQIGNGGTTGSIVGDILNNGVLAFNRSDDFSFGGAIYGSGSLIKDGAGTLTLTGSVTYTGTTTVLGGALLIGNGGNTGNWEGDLSINSALTFNRSDDLVYSHVVSGTGSVTKLGTGTLTYTGANTYTGGTTISVGTLQVGNGGTTGSLVGNITNNANLAFNRSDSLSFGGVISGTGTLTKLGAGTLTLTGNNTYAGGTAISAGTLQVGDGGTSGKIAGNVTNNGTLVFNRSDNITYAGAVSGSGSLSKLGGGTLVVSGNNTYTGTTTVDGGLTVSGGGRIEGTSGITLGQGALQSGTMHVTGAGSRVTTAGIIVVGSSGTGILTVDEGATVTASTVRLGEAVGSIGMLNIGSGAAPGALNAATVIDGAGANSVVNLNHTDASYTLASNLLNTLTLNQNGTGTTTLTGTNSYTGGTYINAGTLRVSSNLNLGGAASVLNFNGGTLQLGATITNLPRAMVLNSGGGTIDTGTFTLVSSGAVFGPGGLTKLGSGTLTLNGTSNYTGGTTVSAGTLRGTTDSLKNNITNNGNVSFLQSASGTYSGVMSGSGTLTKLSAGNLTMSGANTFTGLTTISSGTLTVNGSLASPVTVGESGMLAGSGTIHGAVSVSGIVAPGNPATAPFGTLTVNNNLTFEPGSILRVQANELGQNSKINITGATHSATINGGTVEVLTGGGEYAASTQYTLVSAAGGVTGAFDSVSTDFAFLDPTLSYGAHDVFLTLERNDVPFTALAKSGNQVVAASYIESLSHDEEARPLIQSVTNLAASNASQAFEDLSGGTLGSMSRVSMGNTARLFELMASRLGSVDAAGASGTGTGLAFSTLSTGAPRAFAGDSVRSAETLPGTGLWARQLVTGNGGYKKSGDDVRAPTQGAHTAIGFDANLGDETLVGMSAVYSRDDVDLAHGRARASQIRTPRLMAYMSRTTDDMKIRGVVGCGEHSYQTERAVTLGLSTSLATASHSARECSAYAQAEFGGDRSESNLRPIVGLLYSHLDERAYVETGSTAALAVEGRSTESITSNAGLRYTRAFGMDKGLFEARAVWSHEYGDANPALSASLAEAAGNGNFTVPGALRSRDSAIVGAGVAAQIGRNLLFHTDYNLEVGTDHRAYHTFLAGVSYRH